MSNRSNNFETFKQPVLPRLPVKSVKQPPAGRFRPPARLPQPKKGKA